MLQECKMELRKGTESSKKREKLGYFTIMREGIAFCHQLICINFFFLFTLLKFSWIQAQAPGKLNKKSHET